jgi:transcriptional regulator GlxA family with amidase domain
MHITILAFNQGMAIPFITALEVFHHALTIYEDLHKPAQVSVQLAGVYGTTIQTALGVSMECHTSLDDLKKTDLVIIPALFGDIETELKRNQPAIPWIKEQYNQGAELASLCTGSFLIAETGLLDGKAATTHWSQIDCFKQQYPAIDVKANKIIVDEGRICSSGGAMSFLHLLIYLVEKFWGKKVAIYTAKHLVIEPYKTPQQSFAIFNLQNNHQDKKILSTQSYIENHIRELISVNELSKMVALDHQAFIHRFKTVTGNTPQEYIQRVKVEHAKQELETTSQSVVEIAQGLGYDDITSFRCVFVRYTGIPPARYRKRYQRWDEMGG